MTSPIWSAASKPNFEANVAIEGDRSLIANVARRYDGNFMRAHAFLDQPAPNIARRASAPAELPFLISDTALFNEWPNVIDRAIVNCAGQFANAFGLLRRVYPIREAASGRRAGRRRQTSEPKSATTGSPSPHALAQGAPPAAFSAPALAMNPRRRQRPLRPPSRSRPPRRYRCSFAPLTDTRWPSSEKPRNCWDCKQRQRAATVLW